MKEALKLALEALERNDYLGYQANQKAIAAIKEALAQDEKGLFIDLIAQHEGLAEELAQDEQEPVHSVQSNGRHSPLLTHMMNKRTTPPKRPWVGLTDEFCITNMFDMGHYSLQIVFKSRKNADEFKAALKEKNT